MQALVPRWKRSSAACAPRATPSCGGRRPRCRGRASARPRSRSARGSGRRRGSSCPRPAAAALAAMSTVDGRTGGRADLPLSLGSWAGRRPRPSRCDDALEPVEDGVRVADRRGQADALDVVLAAAGQPLEDAHQVRAAVGPGQRVDLVDDDAAQVAEEPLRRAPAARPASPPATPASSSGARRARARTPASRASATSPCQTNRRSPTISVYVPEALLLVVEQRLDRRDVDDADAARAARSIRPASAGNIDASVLPPAVGASTTAFLPSRIASPASSCTGRSEVQPSRDDDGLLQPRREAGEGAHGARTPPTATA